MTTLRLQASLVELPTLFAGIRRNQVPFAAAVAMTKTAREAHVEMQSSLGQRFTVRSRRTQSSLRAIYARKKDWPNLSAGVGVLDQWLARHEEGGPQSPDRGATFAIPTGVVARNRTSTGAIPKARKPRTLIATGRGRRVEETVINTAKRGSIRGNLVLYLLRRRIRLQPRLGGRQVVESVTRSRMHVHFERELMAALKSERVRAGSFTSAQGRFFYLKALKKLGGG